MLNDRVEALDCVGEALDMVTGLADALHMRGSGYPDRDEFCLMLSEVAYQQVERLRDVGKWLETPTQDTPEEQTAP